MRWRCSLIIFCFLMRNAGAEPSYELLPAGSVYLVNSTNQDIVYSLIDNGRTVPGKLLKGDYTLYHISGPDLDNLYISIFTGKRSVEYKLIPENRYVLYWNRNSDRYDVGTSKR